MKNQKQEFAELDRALDEFLEKRKATGQEIKTVAEAPRKAAQERDVIGVFVPAMLLSSLEASAKKQTASATVS